MSLNRFRNSAATRTLSRYILPVGVEGREGLAIPVYRLGKVGLFCDEQVTRLLLRQRRKSSQSYVGAFSRGRKSAGFTMTTKVISYIF
jgi:hypothetical protein